MKEFKVPSRTVPVTLHLHDGSTVNGRLFVPSAGTDGAAGKLVDRLNDDTEHFIPLAEDGRRELLNKDCIVWVRPDDAADAVPARPPRGDAHRVRLVTSLGGRFEGTLRFMMRPERSRLLDYLNAAPRFIAIEGVRDGSNGAALPTLFNRRFIARLEDVSGDRD